MNTTCMKIQLLLIIVTLLIDVNSIHAQDDFNSNLPLILITHTGGTTASGHQIAEVKTIDIDPITQRADITSPPSYIGPMGYKIRGSSSADFPLKQYSMELWDSNQEDFDASLLGLPAESDWILYAPGFYDKAIINNPLVFTLGHRIGVNAPRTKFFELFINGAYQGIYILTEKIKRGKDRVDIEKLDASDNTPPDITGGYILSIDRPADGQSRWATANQRNLNHIYPKHTDITEQQKQYVRG